MRIVLFFSRVLQPVLCYLLMLRSIFCALPVDAGRRLSWITPCKPQ
jgi:hypothetical protein